MLTILPSPPQRMRFERMEGCHPNQKAQCSFGGGRWPRKLRRREGKRALGELTQKSRQAQPLRV
jgi:hypothetical protein